MQPTYHGPSAIGIDDVRLTNVHCLGNETSILNCTHDWLGVGSNCWSGEVGVRCSPSGEDIRNFKGLFVYVPEKVFFFKRKQAISSFSSTTVKFLFVSFII